MLKNALDATEQHTFFIRCGRGNIETAYYKDKEEQYYNDRADKSELFDYDREDEVVLGKWQIAVFLVRVSETLTEHTARTERYKRLVGLIGRVLYIGFGVAEA